MSPVQQFETTFNRCLKKELYRRLSVEKPGRKVLYISGYTDNVIAHHGVLDDGTAFLQKPLAIATLAQKIRQVLDA